MNETRLAEVVGERLIPTHDSHQVPYLAGNRKQRRNMALRMHQKERRQYHKQGHMGLHF